ncbi:EUKARYOTIC TRANSLATION INITIATION FACTOR 5-1-RELATED [Salix viminalis]|uniref:EUKARYOTIC TRANSLATION INITIATION FACTOR 5-1-RELATED n=1 Tax=Salix viminalis TaxID=40686 RepID=A0A9Q0TB86_SALVM|nr:EUKARYOTIC TRANSLATION INITIATION FACTOR 5-1-RELATED [Salix viminalis]KAJ6707448.1 EUKARYOTIC TRANSLATION INITIATION FACTOR 5-1-RELATED [Salix viminalis]
MALQNIGASNSDDAFYRYKMPKMVTKVEGRGNGIKTNIVNMVEIAKALARPASYTTKYFGCELGAQSKFDEKNGTSLVNGSHETVKLAGLLENFIKKYVQCYGCGNPETEIIITKSQMLQLKCAACGFVSDVDMRDKLTTFILKNPPESKKGSKDKKALRRAEKERLKEGEAADEELKKLKKDGKKKGSSAKDVPAKASSTRKKANSSDEERISPTHSQVDEKEEVVVAVDDDDDVQWQTDTSLEAARQRVQEQLSAATADMVMLSTIETEKKAARVPSKENGRPKVASPAREEKPKAENGSPSAHGTLVNELKLDLQKGVPASQLKSTLSSLTGSAQEKMDALFEALFEGVAKGFVKEVAKKRNYLAAAVTQDEGSQLLLLRAIGAFCGKSGSSAVKEVALILKTLYDADVLEEEYVVQWYREGLKGSNKDSQMWKNTKPFIEWLQNAESETEEE